MKDCKNVSSNIHSLAMASAEHLMTNFFNLASFLDQPCTRVSEVTSVQRRDERLLRLQGFQSGANSFNFEIGNMISLQSGAARHSQGFEDKNLGSSPGLLGQ